MSSGELSASGGLSGGIYKPLGAEQVESIHSEALRLLEAVGLTYESGLDEVLALCEFQPERLLEQRDQAAAAFLFLSGMRIDAFVSLPIRGVDLVRMRVQQLPKLGVRTKNNKAAIT